MSDDNNPSISVSQVEESPPPASVSVPDSEVVEKLDSMTEPILTRHSVYYFEPVVFRVEGVLFNVPKFGFMVPGSMFHDMFSLPIPEGKEAEGSEENPIEIPTGVTQQEFFGFLFVMYPFLGCVRADNEIGYEELVGALKLATMWQFPKIRGRAIYFLLPLFKSRHPVDIILVAREYRSRSLLRQGYMTLIEQNVTIQDLRDPHELDWETIATIFSAMTRTRVDKDSSKRTGSPVFRSDKFHIAGVGTCVDTMFKEELSKMEPDLDVHADRMKIHFGSFSPRVSTVDQNSHKNGGGRPTETFPDSELEAQNSVDTHHNVYYIATITIPVEGTLFRLPKADFECIFNQIPPEMSVQSFSRFLAAFYPQINNGPELLDHSQWLDVLHLSTLWGIQEIRNKAITNLSPLIKGRNLVETVLTARKYKVKSWMLRALEELATQTLKSTTIQELRQPFELDWETIAKILSIHGRSRSHPIEVPTHLKRPNVSCSFCEMPGFQRPKGSKIYFPRCRFSCQTLGIPVPDNAKPDETENSIIAGEIRTMVGTDFNDEIESWPLQ